MHRLSDLSQQLVAKTEKKVIKKPLDFDHFRKLSKIDVQEFKRVVYGRNWELRERGLNIIKDNEKIFPHFHLEETPRHEQRLKSAEMMFASKKLVNLPYETYTQDPNLLTLVSNAFMTYDAGFSVKNGVHLLLYLKTIINLGRERHQNFIQRAVDYKDIGCFALTELTHGSNVKGILTQAHYNQSTKQFILNSPTKEAMKFWIGAAAQIANMAVVWAQLYIDGKCYGVHPYIVPIRDQKTHKLLPGVLIGDCGPKNGCNQIDNGFILFDTVRIPWENQLDRISGVDANGKFFSSVEGEEKRFGIQLGALSGGRFMVSLSSSTMALQALTIALRYSCIRRQFSMTPNQPQSLLLQYPLTRRRLMPLLAQSVVYLSSNLQITRTWDDNHMNLLNPQNNVIQQLHGISSIIKPKSGWFASETIKQCRQILGGHGFSMFSKLAVLYNDNDVNNTFQGDNNVLIQQATKFVLDNAQKVLKGQAVSSNLLKFLTEAPSQSDIVFEEKNYLDLNWMRLFLQYCLNQKIQEMGMKMLGLKNQKLPNMEIWNNSQVFLGKTVALIFGDLFYLENSLVKIDQFHNQQNKSTFKLLVQLWCLKVLRESQFVDGVQHPVIEKLMMKLCDQVTNESLGIVEALSSCDRVIGSPFACPEGKGFEKYIAMVRAAGKQNKRVEWWQTLKQH